MANRELTQLAHQQARLALGLQVDGGGGEIPVRATWNWTDTELELIRLRCTVINQARARIAQGGQNQLTRLDDEDCIRTTQNSLRTHILKSKAEASDKALGVAIISVAVGSFAGFAIGCGLAAFGLLTLVGMGARDPERRQRQAALAPPAPEPRIRTIE